MTPEQRVRATLEFRGPDRYPVIHTPGSIGGRPDRVEALRALYAEFPGDFADSTAFSTVVDGRSGPDEACYREETDEWGCLWAFDDPILGGIVKGCPLADWAKLDGYEIPKAPLLDPVRREAYVDKLHRGKVGGYPLGGDANGALFERMQWVRGYESLLMDIAEGRPEVEVLADRILEEHMVPQIEQCLGLGAWFIGFTDDWGTQTGLMISPESWRRIFKPRYERLAALCHEHGAHIWMHSDGCISEIVPDLVEIGIDCLNPQFSCLDLQRLRERTFGRMTIMTDIDQQGVLSWGTPEQVRRAVRRAISLFGHPEGGLILRAFLQINVPLANCRAALEAFRDFGAIDRGGADGETLRLRHPVARQVVQRNDEQIGTIRLAGTCAVAADFVEARVVPAPGASGGATDWRRVPADGLPGEFRGEMEAPAGGWYDVQVRVTRAGRPIAETRVKRVGVGEVFVVAGQSNAANYGGDDGAGILKCEEDRAAAYGNGGWHPAGDPMPGATGEGGSPWCPLADMLVASLDLPVAIASVAVGGASMASWLPGGENHRRLEAVLDELGPHGVRAVLWHQGETDNGSGTTADEYYDGMKRIIESASESAGYPVRWCVAQASFVPVMHKPPPVLSQAVRDAQQRLWRDGLACQGPDTDDLVGPKYRRADQIHFSRAGLIAHGQRWFAMVWSQLFADRPMPRPDAAISGAIPRPEAIEAVNRADADLAWRCDALDKCVRPDERTIFRDARNRPRQRRQ